MNDNYKNSKYINLLNRIPKKFPFYIAFIIVKNQYFTDNKLYYFFCILFRLIHIISFCGDYHSYFIKHKNFASFKRNINLFTCHKIFSKIIISYEVYILIIIIILILFIIRKILIYFSFKNYYNYNNIVNTYLIVIDHILFLFFPFIIEYLSFIYYIYFFSDKFIINIDINKNISLIILIGIINSFLIINYNVENYINIIYSNKYYSISFFDIYSNQKNKKFKNNKAISYKLPNTNIYILIFLQNFVLFIPLENYFKNNLSKIYFKALVSIILFLIFSMYFLCKSKNFNYSNLINTIIDVIFLFLIYTILIDLVLFIANYNLINELYEIIYLIIKFVVSYLTNALIIMKRNSFFESIIIELLFQENINNNEKYFVNSVYYLHQIMMNLNEKNNDNTSLSLVNFLCRHIKHCNKSNCNCKLFEPFLLPEDNKKKKNNIEQLLIILNYLFESSFINFDFYKNCDLLIILAEHFCHLKNNPIISFSFITIFMLKQWNNLSYFQLITLYDLCQKYMYHISVNEKLKIENENMNNNKIKLLINKQRADEFKTNFKNLIISYKVKKLISNYIDIFIKILKFKYIFEDSLTVKFDENNENIISVKTNFYNEKTKIDILNTNKNKQLDYKDEKNINKVIYLLKEEIISYQNITNTINKINDNIGIPIFMVFKYFLFFDLFEGGKLPNELGSKLFNSLDINSSLFNGSIKKNEYNILKRKYIEQNNRMDSKFYSIYEFKDDLITKYFSEENALKLGYKQNDIINKKIDILMPKVFFKSHQNAINQLIFGNQIKYNYYKQSFYFDKSHTILYPASFEFSLIYNISKRLNVIIESKFNYENEYIFLLDNNFELLSNSKNFENEYYLNQKLFQIYNLGIMEILKLKPDKVYTIFENEFKKINYLKIMKQAKVENYFIPQFYTSSNDKTSEIMNQTNFKRGKNNIISKILYYINEQDNHIESINSEKNEEDKEEDNFIKKATIKKSIFDFFIKPEEFIFHKTYSQIITKEIFIKNLSKALEKIPDTDLLFENDLNGNNLIISSKNLIANLLTKHELSKQYIQVNLRFSYYYDRPFYFITVNDPNKSYLEISNIFHFENDIKKDINSSSISIKTKIPTIPNYKNDFKSRNKVFGNNYNSNTKQDEFKILEKKTDIIKNKINTFNINMEFNSEKNDIIKKINEKKKKINKDRFIFIIKWILSIIITFILAIYIILNFYQSYLIEISNEILLTSYSNSHLRDILMFINSRMLQIFYDYSGLSPNEAISDIDYKDSLNLLSEIFGKVFSDFYDYYIEFKMSLGNKLNFFFIKENFTKLRGFWEEKNYDSFIENELEISYFLLKSLDLSKRYSKEFQNDLKNFIFFKKRGESHEKVNSDFIIFLHYLNTNFEFRYKSIFLSLEKDIYNSYKKYIKYSIIYYIIIEIIGFLLYVAFYITVNFYLFYSNEIIIKNIIFLYLDCSEENFNNNNNNIINLKLKEFKYLIDDFDLNSFENYSKNIENINKNASNKNLNEVLINNKKFSNNKRNSISKNLNNNNFDLNKKETNEKKPIKNNKLVQLVSSTIDINNIDSKTKEIDNSSQNNLEKSNNKFFKDKLNNNKSINSSNAFLTNNNSNNISIFMNNFNRKIENRKNFHKDEIEEKDDYNDIILNKSNKITILYINIYYIIMFILIISISIISIYKIQYTMNFNKKFNNSFEDIIIISDKYSTLYYFFNILRTLLIFPDDNRKKILEEAMENMNDYLDKQNNEVIYILFNKKNIYKETASFYSILMISKNNSTDILKQNICEDNNPCLSYLDSKDNIFSSGFDFSYKICLSEVKNIYLNYKKLTNNSDINEINSTLINSPNSKFQQIGNSLSNLIFYVKEKIFKCIENDINNFNNKYNINMSFLNILTIIFGFLTFLFVNIIIFISISKFSEPIKDSTYRINCSFYYIKQYSLTKKRKYDTTVLF